ncbi:hypothetical protein [Streptacidiphilus cavernicola]|uniref:DUF4397 domain-containing protein n=1 Tax=Streptacidiphilus cavernicola TaxID=3342716 RepID=A0ABV6W573_9ACTN
MVRLKVAGAQGLPSTGLTAVTLNLTGLDATAGTWIAAYRDGAATPTASDLNLAPGQITPNQVTVPVAADGYIDLYNYAGTADILADVQGYYTTAALQPPAGYVTAKNPTRILDTRNATGTSRHAVGPGSTVTFRAAPPYTQASAVVLNLTETDASATSYIGVQRDGKAPTTSVLNFHTGQTTSNQVVVPLDYTGLVTLYNHSGTVDLVADVQGYDITDPSTKGTTHGAPYVPLTPTRILDTRNATGARKAPLGPGSHLVLKVGGTSAVPAGASAVLINLTGITPTASTWLTAYPHGSTPTTSSNLNLTARTTRAVTVLVPIGPDGSIDLYNAHGSLSLAADIEGYYLPS